MKDDTNLFVWGPSRINNQLLASQIGGITGVAPICIDDDTCLNDYQFNGNSIVFCDCDKMDAHACCVFLTKAGEKRQEDPAIVLLNVHNSAQLIDEITKFKIKGIFFSQDSWENLNKGLKLIYQGEYWLPRDLLVQSLNIIREQPKKRREVSQFNLTKRETEILTLIATGLTNKDIAEKLCISFNTVKTHVGNIFKKIDVNNRVQAILWSAENFNHRLLDDLAETEN